MSKMETIKVSFEIESALGLDFFNGYDSMVESLRATAGRTDIKNLKYKVVKPKKKVKPEPVKEYLEPGWYERSDMPIDNMSNYVLHVLLVEDGRSYVRWFSLARREYTSGAAFALDLSDTGYVKAKGYTFRKLVAEDKKMFRYETPPP